MYMRGLGAEVRCECEKVGGVGGEDAVVQSDGNNYNVGVYDICGLRFSQ